jgi:hypothetical protein
MASDTVHSDGVRHEEVVGEIGPPVLSARPRGFPNLVAGDAVTDDAAAGGRGNPRIYQLVEHAPKTGNSPTIWAWPQMIEYFKVAGQPVQGPWPPHQEPRPDPSDESLPVAIPDPMSATRPGEVGDSRDVHRD